MAGLAPLALFSAWAVLTVAIVQGALGRTLLRAVRDAGPDVHWTERARRYFPFLHFSANLRILAGAAATAFGAVFIGLLTGGEPCWIGGAVAGTAAWIAGSTTAVIEASRALGEPLERGWVREVLFLGGLPAVQVFGILAAVFLVPADWSVRAALTALAASLGFLAFHFGALPVLGRLAGFQVAPPALAGQLVAEAAGRRGIKPPGVSVFRTRIANAYAFPIRNAIAFTTRLLEVLDPAGVRAITAHEIAHLGEPLRFRVARAVRPLAVLPLFLLRPALAEFGPVALPVLLLLVASIVAVSGRLVYQAEIHADAAARHVQAAEGDYARALEAVYRANLMPAVMPARRLTHPHLYDRLISAGLPPDYPRPAPPRLAGARLALGAAAVLVILAGALSLLGTVVFTN